MAKSKSKGPKRLYRSRTDRILLGVCGGIAEFFEIDPTIVRILWILGTLVTLFTGVIFYLIAAIIIPEK